MREPELKICALLVLGLAGDCRQSADAQPAEPKSARRAIPPPPPSLPPLPKTPVAKDRPTKRPSQMPCAITSEFVMAGDTTRTVYRLYYRRDGRLGLATKRTSTSYCRTTPCLELPGREEMALRYEYDSAGRLAEVRRYWGDLDGLPAVDRMTITYSASGKVDRYTVVGARNDRYADQHETKLAYDGYGELAAAVTKGKMWGAGVHKTQTTTGLKDCREPYLSSPVVWPFEPDVLYFGWASRFDTLKIEGMKPGFHSDEFRFRPDGNLLDRAATLNGHTSDERWTFEYSCGEERAAEEVSLEAN